MPDSTITPAQEVKLRVTYDIKRDYLRERNVIDESVTTRRDLNEAIHNLDAMERRVLERRLDDALERVDEMFEDEQKTFDHPKVTHSDLVDGVRIPGFYD